MHIFLDTPVIFQLIWTPQDSQFFMPKLEGAVKDISFPHHITKHNIKIGLSTLSRSKTWKALSRIFLSHITSQNTTTLKLALVPYQEAEAHNWYFISQAASH
uniref:Uncharacterized protein n=1 Tax=Arundo donax TaxID=35708 RepID=A0A0A9FYK9_ARUDO